MLSIRSIEEQIAALPADDSAGQSETAAASAFPEFTGKDLDGNAVDSSLFANNAYTVVNFWFSGCKPCVAELGELDKLNQTAKQQGGEVIGINTETLDGSADAIATAKEILQTKGARPTAISISIPRATPVRSPSASWPSRRPMCSTGTETQSASLCSAASTTPIIWRSSRKHQHPPSPPIKNKTEHS